MTVPILPIGAWVPVTTRRLRNPLVLWTAPGAAIAGFDPGQVYCCPKEYETSDSYTDEIRQEGADRYGGTGIGMAGGSGRCSSFKGLQTKGVGVTSLVGLNADRFHSSGTLMLVEAATEAVFAGAYQAGLPFGAVPVHAVVATGGEYQRELNHDSQARCMRALVARPLVARPAHFMRNICNPHGRQPMGSSAKGWTEDAVRTRQSLSLLAANLKQTLGLQMPDGDDIATLDAGLREVVRRYAWQCAAGFAKRLPHGTLGCSNIALSGAYMDFGLSNFVPSYRRLRWAMGQDPWTEAQFPLNTLLTLRQQLGKYHLGAARAGGVVNGEAMAADYGRILQERLAIEMARMAGLTEDLAMACPPELLGKWFRAMRSIWMRGADEQFVSFSGHMSDGQPTPAPRKRRQYDLNAVLTAAGPHSEPLAMDEALRPHLDDPALRQGFVTAAAEVRAWLQSWTGSPQQALDAYLGRQAARKNAELDLLRRDENASLSELRRLEVEGDIEHVGAAIDAALQQARHGLADLCPALPGSNGLEQLQALADPGRVRISAAEHGQEPAPATEPA